MSAQGNALGMASARPLASGNAHIRAESTVLGAPKARSMSAQGNALGLYRNESQALKGRPIDRRMPQSLARIYLHLIFSTKDRAPVINDRISDSLHRYMATVLKNLGCHANLINSVTDHVHILFELGRTVAVSKVVEDVKTSSSKWIKTQTTSMADREPFEFRRRQGLHREPARASPQAHVSRRASNAVGETRR
jgi:REP element-mobilizing transposase RayT